MARPPHRGRGRGRGRGRCRDGPPREVGRFRAEAEVEESGTEVEEESLTQDEVNEQEDAEDAADTQPPGGPEDRSLLVSFDTHVAAAIWQGQERSSLRLHHHPSYLNKWELTDERMKEKIKNSGLLPLTLITQYICNSHRVSAFVERWHPETNSFHFDFGEMAPTLDDVDQLLGIPTYGLAVHTDDARDAKTLLKDLLGVSENQAKNALAEAKGGQAVTFDWLRMYFSELRESDTDERVTYCSRTYLLYVLGCTLLCDKTGSKVNVAPLTLLEDLDRVSHYGWGASALAFLYRQLGQASRRDTKQLSGFLTLLEAWIDEHFPVFNPVANPDYTEDLPRALRWVSRRESGTSQSYYRKLLDDIGAEQVIFNPYQKRRQVVPSNAFYTGPIRAMHIVEPHLPDRVLRQFGQVQQIPADPIAPTRVSRGVKKYVVDYQWTAGYWSSPDYHSVPHSRRICTTPEMPWACSSDYLGWFRKVSHPRVGRGEGIVRRSIVERVDAVLEVVDKALGNDTLQPLELRATLKEVRDILRPTRTLTTYVRRRARGRGQGIQP